MLTTYPSLQASDLSVGPDVAWVDLFDPTTEERSGVEARYGLALPSRDELSEVELSSRVSEKNGVLFLNMPAISRGASPDEPSSPLGFVLTKAVLITVRYAQLRSFESAAARISKDIGHLSSIDIFGDLVDEMVELSADLLEETARNLDVISSQVFSRDVERGRR